MNFERDLRSADSFLSGRVVMSLVLLREWSRMEEGTMAAMKGCAVVLEQLKRLSIANAQSHKGGVQEEVSGVLIRVLHAAVMYVLHLVRVHLPLRTQVPQEYAQLRTVVRERIGEEFMRLFVERSTLHQLCTPLSGCSI